MQYRIVYNDTLSHHGILGQRWGKRNGPPYPLDAGDHSASEKKAGWRKSLDSTSDNPEKYKYNNEDISVNKNSVSKGGISAKKVLLVAGGVAVAGLAGYATYKYMHDYPVIPSTQELDDLGIKTFTPDKFTPETIDVPPFTEDTSDFENIEIELKVQPEKDSIVHMSEKIALEGYYGTFNGAKMWFDRDSSMPYNTEHNFDKALWDSLSENQQSAIKRYTGSDYALMNKSLRGFKTDQIEMMSNKINKKISDMTEALDKSIIKEDTVVHRGTGLSPEKFARMFGIPKEALMSQEAFSAFKQGGFTYSDPAFFSSGGSVLSARSGIILHTFVPKGTKGMYVAPISMNPREDEFVLQRNTQFEIVDAHFQGDALLGLYVKVVGQDR